MSCGRLVQSLVLEHGEQDVASAAGEAHEGCFAFLAFGSFAVVKARLVGSCNAAKAERNNARLSLRFPDLAGCSPRIEVPDWWVTGAMPAYVARCPADLNAEPSPTFEKDARCCPDSDAWHRDQDRGKRVGIEHSLHVHIDCFPLLPCLFERVRQFG